MKKVIFTSMKQMDLFLGALDLHLHDQALHDVLIKGLEAMKGKEDAVSNEDYDKAADLRHEELELVRQLFKMLETRGFLRDNKVQVEFDVQKDTPLV